MKKISAICISIIMSIAFIMPTGIFAETDPLQNPTEPLGAPSQQDETEWFKLKQDIESTGMNGSVGTISLDSDVTADLTKDAGRTIEIKANQNIVLKGNKNIKGIGFSSIKIDKGGSLTIDGPSISNTQIIVEGKLSLNNGKISDTKLEGPTIFVNSGKFTMNGGEISGNEAIESQAPQPSEINNTGKYFEYSPITIYSGDINITGGKVSNNKGFLRGGAIGVWGKESSKANVVISGGEFTSNKAEHPRFYALGGSLYMENCKFEMSKGTFSNNTAEFGGGINAVKTEMTFLGCNITENTNGEYVGKGGGIFADTSIVNIKNLSVSKNSANGNGGGLYLLDCTCNIDNGDYTGNSSRKSGGAISFSGECTSKINAGVFKNNESNGFWGGGAIYNDGKSKLTINRALIKNNTIEKSYFIGAGNHPASRQGGGIWNCPTGNTEINITNGLALYENTAPNLKGNSRHKGAGDDFANITKYEFNKPVGNSSVKLASRMLGGGARLWYQDGSFYSIHTNLDNESEQAPRFDPKNPGEHLPYNTVIEEKRGAQLVYKSVPRDESKALAEEVATSIFTDNKALGTGISGGCIANNGKLIFGEDTPYTLKIVKSWTGDNSKKRPKEIKLKMYVGEHYVQDVKLTEKENWTKDIEDFPDPDTLIDNKTGNLLPINFKEEKSGKYVFSVVSNKKDEKKSVYTINLDNSIQTSVNFVKKWEDNNNKNGSRPKEITVGLYANGKYTGKKISVSDENNWKGLFDKLPKYENDKLIKYEVKEITKVEGYTGKITGDAKDGFTITNSLIPPGDEPKTGDKTNTKVYFGLLGVAVVLILALIIAKRKK